jgi:formamidopyrimidine-DNA glycosylase
MTGQLLFQSGDQRIGGGHPTKDFDDPLPSKSTRVVISFADTTVLYFNDQRVFGWMKLVDKVGLQRALAGLGPDANNPTISATYFFEQLQRRSVAIKLAVMDNSIVAGVGNIYANDALHLATIDPRRAARSLSRTEAKRLLTAIQNVIALGIETGGATIQHYRTIDGLTGTYQEFRRVYGLEGKSCPVCGTEILRITQAGRSSFMCLHCQR